MISYRNCVICQAQVSPCIHVKFLDNSQGLFQLPLLLIASYRFHDIKYFEKCEEKVTFPRRFFSWLLLKPYSSFYNLIYSGSRNVDWLDVQDCQRVSDVRKISDAGALAFVKSSNKRDEGDCIKIMFWDVVPKMEKLRSLLSLEINGPPNADRIFFGWFRTLFGCPTFVLQLSQGEFGCSPSSDTELKSDAKCTIEREVLRENTRSPPWIFEPQSSVRIRRLDGLRMSSWDIAGGQ